LLTSSHLNLFLKLFHCWKENNISNKTQKIIPIIPYACCRTTVLYEIYKFQICRDPEKSKQNALIFTHTIISMQLVHSFITYLLITFISSSS